MHSPDEYIRDHPGPFNSVQEIAAEFADVLGEMKGRCIDIGAGPANASHDLILPKLNPEAKLVCADISDQMLTFAKETYKENDRMSFVKLDVQTKNLPPEMTSDFDHALSFYCLHWCQDFRQTCENIFHLLKPGGTALLAFFGYYPLFNTYEILATHPQYQPYMTDVENYIPVYQRSAEKCKLFESLLADIGFETIKSRLHDDSWIYSIDKLKQCLASVNPFSERFPDDLREQFLEDLKKEMIKQSSPLNDGNHPDSHGCVRFDYKLIIAYIRKPKSYHANGKSENHDDHSTQFAVENLSR